MEKIKEKISRCIKSLQKAPPNLSKRLAKFLRKLSDFVGEHPELSEKTVPILLRVYSCLSEGNYSEAFEQLLLLLILIEIWRRRK